MMYKVLLKRKDSYFTMVASVLDIFEFDEGTMIHF
jgi:hypothetical protein